MVIRFEQGLKKGYILQVKVKILDENILTARTFFLHKRQKYFAKTVREIYVFLLQSVKLFLVVNAQKGHFY
jgi:hypothetical protein